jgi:hypothetical protein
MQPDQTPPQVYGPQQSGQPETQPTQNWQQPETPGTPPPKKKFTWSNWSKKKTLIVLGAILVVIIGVILVKGLAGKDKSDDSVLPSDDSIYHFRDGYDIKQYGSSIGDPLALNMDKHDGAFNSSAGPVVYACDILTIQELNAQKAYVAPNSGGRGVTRSFIDGVGKAGVKTEHYSLPENDKDGNSCTYGQDPIGAVDINVYQKPFVDMAAVQDETNRLYSATTSVNGLATYQRKDDEQNQHTYILVSGNDALQVRFNSKKMTDQQRNNLLQTAAKNFTTLQKSPKGPAIAAYDTPTFKKSYAKACDLITNDDIKSLTGDDASVYVTEGLSTGTAVAKVSSVLYNSITTECSRYNTGLGSGLTSGPFDQQLDITVTSYQDEAPAKLHVQSRLKGAKNVTAASIGSEGYGYQDSAQQNTLIFRQGRFVVEATLDRAVQSNANLTDTSAMTQKLTPYAQGVATKLKAMN